MPSAYVTRTDLVSSVEGPLHGLRVSLKDCFDLAGYPTSAGSRFYLERGVRGEDSAVAALLKRAGATIVGKTQMHQLAYGITGENADFGDMTQPLHPERLTGGSSSGAAASVQDGSVEAAIGTDTGGSIRVPAALCGLCGYRSSVSLNTAEMWRGGAHLAKSFDTLGWLYRELSEGPVLGRALFGFAETVAEAVEGLRFGLPGGTFLRDCEPEILAAMERQLEALRAGGAVVKEFEAAFWDGALAIYSPIVAYEAAKVHAGNFAEFEPVIAERLAMGARTTAEEAQGLYARLAAFRGEFAAMFEAFDYLLLPCSPVGRLIAGEDQAENRGKILRYTTPVSLAGCPVVTLPGGLQLVGRMGADAALLALSAGL